jgi:hypothetical protein
MGHPLLCIQILGLKWRDLCFTAWVCKRLGPLRRYVSGYFAGYLVKPLCYVYGPFGRCTTGVGLLP